MAVMIGALSVGVNRAFGSGRAGSVRAELSPLILS
jgi:hypothetical protein